MRRSDCTLLSGPAAGAHRFGQDQSVRRQVAELPAEGAKRAAIAPAMPGTGVGIGLKSVGINPVRTWTLSHLSGDYRRPLDSRQGGTP